MPVGAGGDREKAVGTFALGRLAFLLALGCRLTAAFPRRAVLGGLRLINDS